MTFTEAHLVNTFGNRFPFSADRFFLLINRLLKIIKEGFERREPVMISGFGKFQVKEVN